MNTMMIEFDLEHDDEKLGLLCVAASPTEDMKDIHFVVEQLLYVAETEDNKTLSTETFRSAEFSAWLAKKVSEGWRLLQ